MNARETIVLLAKDVVYCSNFDEDSFFAWLNKISCVEKYEGRGNTVYITVRDSIIDELNLRELLSLFSRYKIDLHQLVVFDRNEFSSWFRDKNAYWYDQVFD